MLVQHIVKGVVVNVFLVEDASTLTEGILKTPSGEFPAPLPGESFMTQPDAGIGWTLLGSKLFPPAAPEARPVTKDELLAFANRHQWRVATGGHNILLNGKDYLFPTDEASYALIMGKALRLSQPDAPQDVVWQLPSGFVTIPAAAFIRVAASITDFMQASFDALTPVREQIEAGSITTKAQVEAASWPAP